MICKAALNDSSKSEGARKRKRVFN